MIKIIKNSFYTVALTLSLATASMSNAFAANNVKIESIDQTNPTEIVKAAVGNTFSILDDYKGKISSNNQALRKEINSSVLPYFNTKYIAASLLNQYYKTATPEQFDKFTEAVTNYMVTAYIEGLSFYKQQKVDIAEARKTSNNFAEGTVTVSDKKPIKVVFKMLKRKDNNYRIIDFTAEGISIVQTKRIEWTPILQKGGVVALTDYINKNSSNILKQFKK